MTAFSLPPQLDLTDPADFLLALYYARDYPKPKIFNREQWDRDLATVERYHTDIFDLQLGYSRNATPVYDFLADIGKATPQATTRATGIVTPREFLPVFTIAFKNNLISDIAYSVAVSTLLTRHGVGNGAPSFAPDSIAGRLEMLDAVKSANPRGLMFDDERERWEALPDLVTIYRGGYMPTAINRSEALHDAHLSLFWGFGPEVSSSYARVRANQTQQSQMQSLQTNFRNAFTFGLPMAQDNLGKLLSEGQSFLIKAEVPREMILGYRIVSDGRNDEVMVDFPKITPDMITDISDELTGKYRTRKSFAL